MRVLDGPDGPEPHNGLLYSYEGTNITGKKVVNHPRMKLNDAFIAFYGSSEARSSDRRSDVPSCLMIMTY